MLWGNMKKTTTTLLILFVLLISAVASVIAEEDLEIEFQGGKGLKIYFKNNDNTTHNITIYANATFIFREPRNDLFVKSTTPSQNYSFSFGYRRFSFGKVIATVTENDQLLATRSGFIIFSIVILTK